jgi:hypothetical protein
VKADTERERAALNGAIADAVAAIESERRRRPEGYNVGFNASDAAASPTKT